MDYEKRYKEALKRAKDMLAYKEVRQEDMEYLFPELKESEEEKILKTCIKYLDREYQHCSPVDDRKNIEKCINWLEKQCKRVAADKTESKFKIGDWVVLNNDGEVWQIGSIYNVTGELYYLYNKNRDRIGVTKEELDNDFHLWTIQDAKDGDVLTNDEYIFIYNNTCILQAYCYYHTRNEKFYIEDRTHHHKWIMSEVTPATKEQCDLLFAKMRDSGHEWDAEKQELKKIKPTKLDAAEVIKWLNHRELMSDEFINRFKKYFGL